MMKPETIDTHAREFNDRKEAFDLAKEYLDEQRDKILALIEKHGRVPEKAEKSKRLEGIEFQLTASFGDSVKVDVEYAELFKQACEDAHAAGATGFAGFFARVFKFEPRYTLTTKATQIMSGKLPAGAPRALRAFFAKAVTIEKRSPTVKVEPRKVEHK
jgi:hypothetical protein